MSSSTDTTAEFQPRTLQYALVCACAALFGCTPTPAPRYYSLAPQAAESAEYNSAAPPRALLIGPLRIPHELEREEMARRKGPYEIVYAERDRWSAPLEEQIGRTVAENIMRATKNENVFVFPHPYDHSADRRLEIEIVSFLVNERGSAELDALWRVIPPESAAAPPMRRFSAEAPVSGTSADGDAAALSTLLGSLSTEIARELSAPAHAGAPIK